MQKLWIPLLCLLFAYSFSGCGNNPTNQIQESKAEETESQLVTEESSASAPESSKPEQSAEQAVLSFLNEYDLTGKTVVPFCTHDGYGAGGSYETIREASHAAESPDGLTVEAKDVLTAENTVAAWLEEIGIRGKSVGTEMTETTITIKNWRKDL